jgi:anti-sigma B factor antagonist
MDTVCTAVRDGDPSEAVVTVYGEIDLATREQLRECLHTATAAPGVKRIVVDLTQTRFMDSSGIYTIVHGYEEARKAGIDYYITGANGPVHRVLELTGVLNLLLGDTPVDERGA